MTESEINDKSFSIGNLNIPSFRIKSAMGCSQLSISPSSTHFLICLTIWGFSFPICEYSFIIASSSSLPLPSLCQLYHSASSSSSKRGLCLSLYWVSQMTTPNLLTVHLTRIHSQLTRLLSHLTRLLSQLKRIPSRLTRIYSYIRTILWQNWSTFKAKCGSFCGGICLNHTTWVCWQWWTPNIMMGG